MKEQIIIPLKAYQELKYENERLQKENKIILDNKGLTVLMREPDMTIAIIGDSEAYKIIQECYAVLLKNKDLSIETHKVTIDVLEKENRKLYNQLKNKKWWHF